MNAEKWHHSEIRIAINDESQGSIRIFKIGEHLAKLRAKSMTVIYPIRLALLSSKMQISPDKLNNLCIIDKNCY